MDPDEPPSGAAEPDASPARVSAFLARRERRGVLARARRLRLLARLWRLYALRLAPSEGQRLFALTVLIGVACGLAAVAFHLSIQVLESNLIERALSAGGARWIAWTIATPALGGLACGALLQRWMPRARGSGIPEVKASFARVGPPLRMRDAVGKFALSALQIGTGSSLGREGPTVHICAGLASLAGRAARVSGTNLRRLLPVGAAAGVAAAFNAPIAAVTFVIEEIVGDLDKTVLTGVIVAAAIAAVIERAVLGAHPVFELPRSYGLEHASSLVVFALLGVVAGLVSVLFTDALLGLRAGFRALTLVPDWLKPALGGALTGGLAVAALSAFGVGGITGGGYATLAQALDGHLAARAMLALCGLKLAATVFSYSSGGAGGIFSPTLFVGAMLGGAMGGLDASLLGHDGELGAFALVGMGAVFAGTIRAPITSVLIIVEMTDGYGLILPLMIANMIAYWIAHRSRPLPIYDALLAQDGVRLPPATGMHVLESIPLERVLAQSSEPVTFEEHASAGELVRARTRQEVYPVVERGSRRLLGLVTDEELELLAAEPGLDHLVSAGDVMRPPVSVRRADDLRTVLETMLAHGLTRLPVVDDELRLTGLVDEAMIARVYLHGHSG